MELQFSPSSFPFQLCLLVFAIFLVVKMGKRSKSKPIHPPGPWRLPFIGNMHQMISILPHQKLRDLAQKYGPLMHIQLGEVPLLVVTSPEMASEVMKKQDINFANRPQLLAGDIIAYGSTNIVFSPYGEYWRQLRKICTMELLSAQRVQSFREFREKEMLRLVDWITSNEGKPINITDKLFALEYATIARMAFGKKNKDQDRFIEVSKEIVKIAAGFHIGDVFPSHKWLHVLSGMKFELLKLHHEADKILSDIVDDHRQNKMNKKLEGKEIEHEDLVDVLLKYVEQDNNLGFTLTHDNVKAVILDMFAGGSETAATTLCWALAEMMKNREILEKAQNEVRQKFNKIGRVEENDLPQLEYLQLIIKETLRLHPPGALLLPRECRIECEVGGFEIPLKTRVLINAWAIARDPKYWKEPEKFDPERFLNSPLEYHGNSFEYLPFGSGKRICPGMVFALTNMEYQLASLLFHFDWKLPNGVSSEKLDMTEEFGVSVKRKEDLFIVPTLYQPPASV